METLNRDCMIKDMISNILYFANNNTNVALLLLVHDRAINVCMTANQIHGVNERGTQFRLGFNIFIVFNIFGRGHTCLVLFVHDVLHTTFV